jgi:hypothetical protein
VIWSSRISPRRTRWSIVSLRFQKLACLQVGCGAEGRAGCELPGVQAGSAGVAWEEKAVEGYGKQMADGSVEGSGAFVLRSTDDLAVAASLCSLFGSVRLLLSLEIAPSVQAVTV